MTKFVWDLLKTIILSSAMGLIISKYKLLEPGNLSSLIGVNVLLILTFVVLKEFEPSIIDIE